MKYKVLILDDEEPARDLLDSYVQKLSEVEVVYILKDALSAKRVIHDSEIDILVSDIQMPDLTGIDLLKTLRNPPVTIFTTAYSEYALEGFELEVADHLVKPITFQRFCKAMDRAIELIEYQRMKQKIGDSTVVASADISYSEYFFVKTSRKVVKVIFGDILFVESYGEYVKIYTKDDVLLALQTTSSMEKMLPSDDFVRIHRSHIVNLGRIDQIEGNTVSVEKHRLTVSKRMKERFMKMIASKGRAQ